jgi:predicted glycoside hydrolase/deacetylase ChbG (UPF0249 family)
MKKIIISADDFAQSEDIDTGILQLIKMGRLTATSCLTLSPRWQEAAKTITPEMRKQADIGLHLDFTQYPQTLKNKLSKLIVKAYCGALPHTAIVQSIHRQLDHFEQALDTPPDYIDGHQHVHQLPQIREALIEVLTHRYSPTLPWLRISKPLKQDGLKARVIGALGANGLERLATAANIRHTQSLLGVYDFNITQKEYQKKLNSWFSFNHVKSTAFMCHPALTNARNSQQPEDPIYPARLTEYQVLADDAFMRMLEQHQITLIRGSNL